MAGPRSRTIRVVVRTFESHFAMLLFESHPMRTLFDCPALLRFDHLLSHPVEFLQYDRLAAHSSHERDDQWRWFALEERRAALGVYGAAATHAAESHVGFDHAHHFEFAEGIPDLIGWVRPDGSQPYHADLCAAITHVPNCVTRRHRMAALYKKDDVGSFGHEFF